MSAAITKWKGDGNQQAGFEIGLGEAGRQTSPLGKALHLKMRHAFPVPVHGFTMWLSS